MSGCPDAFNRQLHPDEKQKLAQLQQGQSKEEQDRLADAACYLVQCAAQMSDNDPAKAAAQDSQNRGAGYVTEQRELSATGLFVYNPLYDTANDALARGGDWLAQQAKSVGRGASNMATKYVNTIVANSGQTGPSDANNQLPGANDGNNTPSGTAGAVVTPSVPIPLPNGAIVTTPPLIAPGTPIMSSGDGGNDTGGGASGQGAATNTTAGADSAANAVNGLNLNKSLASQQQLSQLTSGNGINIAGNGTNVPLRDAPRLASEYGGQASDWSKVSSSSYTASNGSQFEIHAYRNAVTGQVVELKSIPLK